MKLSFKLTNRKLLFLAFLLSLGLKASNTFADMIPGYIGNQSFRLSDDRDLANLMNAQESAKVDYARIDQSRAQMQDQVNTLGRQVSELKTQMDQLNADIVNDQNSLKQFNDKLAELNKNPEANKDEIATTAASIDRFQTTIKNKSQAYGQMKLQLAPLATRFDQVNHDLQEVSRRAEDARNRMLQINAQREQYERQLIVDIQRINRDGANRGGGDGNADGADLAIRMGTDIGSTDGNNDGTQVGTNDGMARDYKRGADQGDRDGSSRARIDGERDGTLLGTRDGNINAANREGDLAGVKRADGSDASKVGTDAGRVAGMNRAVMQGRIDGENKAENESIQKFESTPLSDVLLSGPFAGSFSRRSPNYPGDFNGSHFHPDVYAQKDIYKKAFADGYVYVYRDQTRRSFLNNIDGAYNRYYDQSYNQAYSIAFNRDYVDQYNQGQRDGDRRAYERDYPIIKNNFYQTFFAKFDQSPNRSASEFKSTFSASELRAYNRHYEEIRKANFDREELATFNSNISAQTEISRSRRNLEVAKVYNENAILAFDASEMLDGGINGVAKLDGVFQPNETTLHNITIRNYGFKAAANVRVRLDNGAEVKLPAIPARSKVVIKGAGQSMVPTNASLGSTFKTSLMVLSSLTSDDAIEGVHFDSMGSGILKSSDVKSQKVQFPFSLSNLSLNSQLLKGEKNKLQIAVSNNSKRAYLGDLKIELLANSQNEIITKAFSNLAQIGAGSVSQMNDAEVLVSSEADIYRDLSFSAKISQNGVVLGGLSQDYTTMAKASYSEKGKVPVIVVDSNKDLEDLLDVLNTLGGSEKVSILDLSLSNLNAGILNAGLSNKSIIVLDDESGKTIQSLNGFFAKSKSSGIALVSDNGKGLEVALGLPTFKDAQKLNLDKRLLLFTNPFRAAGVEASSTFVAATRNGLTSILGIISTLALSSQESVANLKAQINRNNFFTPNDAIKIYSLRTMAEILNINIAYDKSGNIFSRDKKWAEMVSNDGGLFINQIKNAANGSVDESKLGVVLSAIAVKDFVGTAMSDFYDIQRNMMPKILNATNKVLGNMEDGFKKSLKDFNRDLYNNAYEKVSMQRPFYIEPKPQPN